MQASYLMRLASRRYCHSLPGFLLAMMNVRVPVILSAMLILLFGIGPVAAADKATSTVRIAYWKPIDVLDPVYTTSTEQIQMFDALFRGLVMVKNNKVVAGDAESWEISEDGITYTFTLRDDITWSDGEPVKASDYQLAFRRIFDSSLHLADRPSYMLTNIKNAAAIEKGKAAPDTLGVKAVDDRTLVIELVSPASYFLNILTYPGMVPVPGHLLKKHGNDWWRSLPLVSNGAYTLTGKDAWRQVVLTKRNARDYPEAPDAVHLVYLKNADAAVRGVINNDLDIVSSIRKSEVDWVKNRMGYRLTLVPRPNTIYAIFNTKNPKLADRRVRRALYLAIDREAIAKAVESDPAASFAPLTMLKGAESELDDTLLIQDRQSRIKRARELLAEAGYTPDNPLEISIMKVSRLLLGNTAVAMRSMLAQIGVKAELQAATANERSRLLAAKDYEISVGGWMADFNDAMTFYGVLESSATKNHSAFNNGDYDRLIRQALEEQDGLERRKLYARMENILRREAPIVPIVQSGYMIVTAPTIASIGLTQFNPNDSFSSQKFLISIYDIKLTTGE